MTGPAPADPPRIAFVWAQFGPYHLDRLAAVKRRLRDRAAIVGVEIAQRSDSYAWASTERADAGERRVLFPGRNADAIGMVRLVPALWQALRDCDLILLGLASSDPAIAALAAALRMTGKRVYFSSDSKADDYKRSAVGEFAKRILLQAYHGGIIAGSRSMAYYLSLGVAADRLHPGYDTVETGRVRKLAEGNAGRDFDTRPFLYLGRFVAKKNLPMLIRGYAEYICAGGTRRLVMAGSGGLETDLRFLADELNVASLIEWPGFLDPQASATQLARSLALLLVSSEEQWGLVVNEAFAVARPAIVSAQVGACDLLVRNGQNGYILPEGFGPHDLGRAMLAIGGDEARWKQLSNAARDRAWYGDVERFADTVELLVNPSAQPARRDLRRLLDAF